MIKSRKDCLKILQLKEGATEKEIKKAYYRLALKYHPDKNPGKEKEAEHHFKKVNEAYKFLISSKKPKVSGFEDMNDYFDFFDAQIKDIDREFKKFSKGMEMHFKGIEGSLMEIDEKMEKMKYLFGCGLFSAFIKVYQRIRKKHSQKPKKPDGVTDIPILQIEKNPEKGTLHLRMENLNGGQVARIDSILMRFLKKGFLRRKEDAWEIRYLGYPYLFPVKWHYALFKFDSVSPRLYVHLPKDELEAFVSILEEEFSLSKRLVSLVI